MRRYVMSFAVVAAEATATAAAEATATAAAAAAAEADRKSINQVVYFHWVNLLFLLSCQ